MNKYLYICLCVSLAVLSLFIGPKLFNAGYPFIGLLTFALGFIGIHFVIKNKFLKRNNN